MVKEKAQLRAYLNLMSNQSFTLFLLICFVIPVCIIHVSLVWNGPELLKSKFNYTVGFIYR